MKKSVLLISSILLTVTLSYAQEFKTKLANSKDRKVILEMASSAVKIEGHNSDEVIIQASSGYEAPPERAKGLKPLYYSGVDNTGVGLSVTTEGNILKIENVSRKSIKYTIKLPRMVAVLFQEMNWGNSKVMISNMEGDLEIKTNNAKVDLDNVTGPVVANSISGEIKVVYGNVSQSKPTAISTVSGVIDISLPASTKSNLKLRSMNGEIYTDFDLGLKNAKDGLTRIGTGHNIEGTTNGGGVEMALKTISSDIYIRKQK